MTQTDRPLLTRQQAEAMRVRRAKRHINVPKPANDDLIGDLLDTLIAALSELAAVDAFAQEDDHWLRRELRALRGIEA